MAENYEVNLESPALKKKIAEVEEAKELLKKYPTVAMVELKKLPDSLFQNLRKKIREGGGTVKVYKKAVMSRALDSDEKLSGKKSVCDEPIALILTEWSPYSLNSFFKENRKKRAAKEGDTAPFDIVIPAGETDLPPGPALSELKSGGVNVQIKNGKITVVKDSTVVKEGEEVTTPQVKALTTLNIMPFEVSANMLFAYDGDYIYPSELLDMGDTIQEDMLSSMGDAMNFSINASYPTAANAEVLLGQAVTQSMNVAMNSEVYSSAIVELLLSSAARQGMALTELGSSGEEAEAAPEPAPGEPKEGSDAPSEESQDEEKK
jgi:large subunit ribosomal protein L10